MLIKTDSRGSGECLIFNELISLNTNKYTITQETLAVGDYHICKDNGEIVVVIERKTHSDLAGSICTNNHIKEQIQRLKALREQIPGVCIFLLYEGVMTADWIDKKSGCLPNTHACMFLSTVASREGICVHYTTSRTHTARWIYALSKKEEKGELRGTSVRDDGDYLKTLALTKQGNRKSENQYTRLLMSIDSVSIDRARALESKYPTCAALVKRVGESGAEAEISEIMVKKRRIGSTLANSICTLFK